jgi:hypothetical protein
VGRDAGEYRPDFYSVKQKYFREGDWTAQISLIWLKKLDFWRNETGGAGDIAHDAPLQFGS